MRRAQAKLKEDPEKWEPVFGKDHAQTKAENDQRRFLPRAAFLAGARRAGRLAFADDFALAAFACGGSRPASASRIVQYFQVRPGTVSSALSVLTSLTSPGPRL